MPCGIYAIWNTVTKTFYGGSAVDLAKRNKEHWHHLQGGAHHNKALQADWNTYGAQAFTFEVLEVVERPNDLHQLHLLENEWVDRLRGQYATYNRMNSATSRSVADFQHGELTLRDVCRILGKDEWFVRKAINRGELKPARVEPIGGNRVRSFFDYETVKAFKRSK